MTDEEAIALKPAQGVVDLLASQARKSLDGLTAEEFDLRERGQLQRPAQDR